MLTREEALALLNEFNHEPFHIEHALTVERVMRSGTLESSAMATRWISGDWQASCTIWIMRCIPISTVKRCRRSWASAI